MFNIGDTHELSAVVTQETTAAALGSGGLEVLATPYMIALMEGAAHTYMGERLPEGKSSVGVAVDIRHLSPSPVGAHIRAVCELTAISENGKIFDFRVTAYDEGGVIGEGTHQRAIVDSARFLQKCQAKTEG